MPKTLDGVHVLLVEDNADASEVMTLIMEYQGGLVIRAGDAKAALGLLATRRDERTGPHRRRLRRLPA
jgi:CheY-like chemotaxis protein